MTIEHDQYTAPGEHEIRKTSLRELGTSINKSLGGVATGPAAEIPTTNEIISPGLNTVSASIESEQEYQGPIPDLVSDEPDKTKTEEIPVPATSGSKVILMEGNERQKIQGSYLPERKN